MSASSKSRSFSRLAVIVPDRLSLLLSKGEITERYYNPGNLFQEVHLIMTNDDKPPQEKLQTLVGDARLVLHNLAVGRYVFFKTAGFREALLKPWLRRGLALIKAITPDLIRTHNNFLEGYLAAHAKERYGIPYVVSLHGVWDRDALFTWTVYDKCYRLSAKQIQRTVLESADAVLCVYKPILRYANQYGARKTHLVYNAVSGGISAKTSYNLHQPPRLMTVNRQVPEKNPENIIRAVAEINCHYDIIGNGVLHDRLKTLVSELQIEQQVRFVRAMPNAELIARLPEYDLALFHCDYWGISKGILEASLAGLPIIVNNHPVSPIPDYEGDWLITCDNSVEGYRRAILELFNNYSDRENIGFRALEHARSNWDPQRMESKVVSIYRHILRPDDH